MRTHTGHFHNKGKLWKVKIKYNNNQNLNAKLRLKKLDKQSKNFPNSNMDGIFDRQITEIKQFKNLV